MRLSPASLFAILHPMRGGALSKGKPNVAGDGAALRFALCRECHTRLLGAERGSGRALRPRSYRIFGTGRELLGTGRELLESHFCAACIPPVLPVIFL